MKLTLTLLAACGLLNASQTITGTVTDSMCGAKHSMMKDRPDEQCIKMCVKGSSEYSLYDGKTVWKLSDQKAAAKFSARRVNVTGTVNEKNSSIKVSAMEAAPQ